MSLQTGRVLALRSPRQLRALADETRAKIVRVLEDGPSSAKELGHLLQISHGKVGHHLKVLREAGMVELVEERPVRAVVEKFYALTFDRLEFSADSGDRLRFMFGLASQEAEPSVRQPFDPPGALVTGRMTREAAREFHSRIVELANEFAGAVDSSADQVYGLAVSVFLTDTPGRES